MPGPSGHPDGYIAHDHSSTAQPREAPPIASVRALILAALVAVLLVTALSAASAGAVPIMEAEPEARLTAGLQSANGNRFGMSVSLSADGNTALVGAPHAIGLAGGAWIFNRSAGGWETPGNQLAGPTGDELQTCNPDGASEGHEDEEGATEEVGECRFGRSVALSADGNTAVVGAPLLNGHRGSVSVFSRSAGVWTREALLGDPVGEHANRFGSAVAVSGDGRTVIVGAPGDQYSRGAAWIFTLTESGWQASGELSGEGEEGQGLFGQSVAISANGLVALVGAPADSAERGAAWLFTHGAGGWSAQGSLVGAGAGSGAHFGSGVALSSDGSTALVGARGGEEGRGAAWAFAKGVAGWGEQAMIHGAGEAGEEFGLSVALSADGAEALVAAPGYSSDHGAAWTFERSGTTWSGAQEQFQPPVSATYGPRFGSSLATSATLETVLVGGQRDAHVGAAWVFGRGPSVSAVAPEKGPLAGGTSVTITGNNLLGTTAVYFGNALAESYAVTSKHTIVAVTPPGEGTVAITVTTPLGTSQPSVSFKYVAGKGTQRPPHEESPAGIVPLTPTAPTPASAGVLGFNAAGTCAVVLVSRRITVQPRGRAAFRLRASGAGTCSGGLRLRAAVRIGHRVRVRTIGTAVFTMPAGHTLLVRVVLNALGRRILGAHHGRLTATLQLIRQSPKPQRAQSSRVRLVRAGKRRTAHG